MDNASRPTLRRRTGYSLGAHLATAFNLLRREDVAAIGNCTPAPGGPLANQFDLAGTEMDTGRPLFMAAHSPYRKTVAAPAWSAA